MPATAHSDAWIFDSEFLRKLERLELLARKMFRGQLRGEHSTSRRGRGLEFSDFRRYRAGDDLRHIDWNIFSRLERLFLKLYAAEEDMSLHLLLDTSASMGFGDPSKFDSARRLAASLAYIGLNNMDRVAVAAVADGLGERMAPVKSASQVSVVLRFLSGLRCEGVTRLGAGVGDYVARIRSPGIAVLISDLFASDEVYEGVDALRYRGHEVVVLHLLAEEEIDPPLDGALRLVDAETGDALDVTVDGALRTLYLEQLDAKLQGLEEFCRSRGVEYVRASTAVPFEDVVLRYLRQGALLR